MERGPPHRARSWPLLVAATAVLVVTGSAAAERRPTIREARVAARALVREHPSYRSIESTAPLVTDDCRRSRRAVRCSFYRWAPDPCALDGRDGPCAQVLTRRTWLVSVTRRRGRAVARVVRIADTSKPPAHTARARSSS
jgi:hypothetical protein